MEYQSTIRMESRTFPGVWFTITRMSFGRRIELIRRVRDIAAKAEFLEAGSDPRERIDAAALSSDIDRLYVLWGLTEIEGLNLDGQPATPETLVATGPEPLFKEVLEAVKAESALRAGERKN